MVLYVSMVQVRDRDVNNAQDLAAIWGELKVEIEDFDAELQDTYAILGNVDFVVVFEATDRHEAFQVALAAERHGLDLQTMPAVPTDEFANLVEDN